MNSDIIKILYDSGELQTKIRELGKQITSDFSHIVEPLVCIGILKGSFMFIADLVKYIDLPVHIEFMAISSYGDNLKSSGHVKILLDLRQDIVNKHVLIIEDIIDTGLTMKYLLNLLDQRKPASLTVCSLLKKPTSDLATNIKYIGFEIPKDAFVVGFGLDYAEKYRNLQYIGILDKQKI